MVHYVLFDTQSKPPRQVGRFDTFREAYLYAEVVSQEAFELSWAPEQFSRQEFRASFHRRGPVGPRNAEWVSDWGWLIRRRAGSIGRQE